MIIPSFIKTKLGINVELSSLTPCLTIGFVSDKTLNIQSFFDFFFSNKSS